jgi:predicted O-methyltransferase YrrM
MKLISIFRKRKGEDINRNDDESETKYFLQKSVRHYLPSYLLSLDDEPTKPNDFLIQTAIKAIDVAWKLDFRSVANRFSVDIQQFISTFPGEHYRLLGALMIVLKPKIVVEIGTYQGAGCLSMKQFLPAESKIFTYDIIPFDQISGSGLVHSDFDNQMEQRLADLSDPNVEDSQLAVLENADFVFVDAAKDGVMERRFIELFEKVKFKNRPVIMFDDIRFTNMIPIWREIAHPKLDITSFGHWSGTGLVDWTSK